MANANLESVPGAQPLLANYDLNSLHGAKVRIKHDLHKSTDLGSSVPAVGAVDEGTALFDDESIAQAQRGIEDAANMAQPLSVCDTRGPTHVVLAFGQGQPFHLFMGTTDGMNIVNLHKTALGVAIAAGEFETTTFGPVRICVDPGAAVADK